MTQPFELHRVLVAALVAALFLTVSVPPAPARAAARPAQADQSDQAGQSGKTDQADQADQDRPSERLDRTEAIVPIEHADPKDVADVIRVFGVHAVAHPDLGLITIQGNRHGVDAARAAAVALDKPPAPTKSVQVIAYVLDASKTEDLAGGVPDELQPVARQLREIFGYRSVELIDTLAIRPLDGAGGQVVGTLPATDGRPAMPYRLGFNHAIVVQAEDGAGESVQLKGFTFTARTSGLPSESGESAQDLESVSRLDTDLEVRAGQKAVVGKAATAGKHQGLILVIAASVLE